MLNAQSSGITSARLPCSPSTRGTRALQCQRSSPIGRASTCNCDPDPPRAAMGATNGKTGKQHGTAKCASAEQEETQCERYLASTNQHHPRNYRQGTQHRPNAKNQHLPALASPDDNGVVKHGGLQKPVAANAKGAVSETSPFQPALKQSKSPRSLFLSTTADSSTSSIRKPHPHPIPPCTPTQTKGMHDRQIWPSWESRVSVRCNSLNY